MTRVAVVAAVFAVVVLITPGAPGERGGAVVAATAPRSPGARAGTPSESAYSHRAYPDKWRIDVPGSVEGAVLEPPSTLGVSHRDGLPLADSLGAPGTDPPDLYQGRDVYWWARRAVQARKDANARGDTIQRLKRRWHPTVSYAIRLAASVYGVPEQQLRAVAACESTFNPYATNGRYRGLFQLGWVPFRRFSPFDPVANALSAAATVRNDGGWRQWECKP